MTATYVVFEGIDGSGKTATAAALGEVLTRAFYTPIHLAEPSHSRFGAEARELMGSDGQRDIAREHSLFTADRVEHVTQKIAPLLEFVKRVDSFLVIQDRYYLSAPVYQAGTRDQMRALLHEQQRIAPRPDRVFLLDVDAAVAAARIEARGSERCDDVGLLSERRERYRELAATSGEPVTIVDASQPLEVVVRSVWQQLRLPRLNLALEERVRD
jgi:dTMP kinase